MRYFNFRNWLILHCAAALMIIPALAAESTLLEFAACLGGSDQYAENAAQYGYDQAIHSARSERMMKQLSSVVDGPSSSELNSHRMKGKEHYRKLSNALNGKQEGPAWEEFAAFHHRCDLLRKELVDNRVLVD